MNKLLSLLFCMACLQAQAQTVGLFYNLPGAESGYVLFAPGQSDTTYLIDKCGKKIHQWASSLHPGLTVNLEEDGTLLRCNNVNNGQFPAGGSGGNIEKLGWDSELLWSYDIADINQCQHHDAIQLPNGNIMAIVWESHTKTDAQANGRVTMGSKMWSEKIIEIQPVGTDSGVIVWQWRAWDHLVQDADSLKPNYGVVADHPELLNINMGELNVSTADWLHFNSLDYNVALDQVMVSSHEVCEVYIIDHSTTMEEAASQSGGNSGRGGDLLYRWGNPQNYGRGTAADQKFFEQHNLRWISADGQVMVFNNGVGRPGNDYSTVETFTLPAMIDNNYPIEPDSAFKPTAQDWIYTANPPLSLFSIVQGGAQRLPNGNTLICSGTEGEFTEIDAAGTLLWKYVNPVDKTHILSQGETPFLNDCFRAMYYPSYYPGLAGKILTPGAPIEVNPDTYDCDHFPTAVVTAEVMQDEISVYPDPFINTFSIHLPATLQDGSLQVHDIMGRPLYEAKNISFTAHTDPVITLTGQHKGMLIVTVRDKEGSCFFQTTVIAQ